MATEYERRDSVGNVDVKQENSKFHIKSIAYAAQNLTLGETKLEVTPVEQLGYLDGEVTSDQEEFEETGVDAKGNAYSVKISTSNAMVAEWLKWGSNRDTPPNIRRGERVLLWQYAEEDKYYWTSTGLDDHLRRLETVRWVFSNTKDEDTEDLNETNSYYAEVDTHAKAITLRTNKSDGEPFAYNVQINTKDGCLTIMDDVGNSMGINSAINQVWMENADNSYVILDKKNIEINANDTIKMNARNVVIGATNVNVGASSTTIDSNVATNGSLTNNGKNVGSSHTHGGVSSGPSRTGTP